MVSELRVNIRDTGNLPLNHLLDAIKSAGNKLVLEVPCPSIGTAGSHLSIASDYLDALYIGESVAELCENASLFTSWDQYRMSVCFALRPTDVRKLVEKILWLGRVFDDDLDWGDPAFEDVHLSIAEFEGTLEERWLHFPELADQYLANYIGGEYDLDEMLVEEEHRAHPERRYHVWRSFASKKVGYDFFVSPWFWIVPRDSDITKLLSFYGGFDDGVPLLERGEYLSVSQFPSIVYNRSSVVAYPEGIVHRAQECAGEIWPDVHGGDVSKVLLSEAGDILVAADSLASYVLFTDSLQKIPQKNVEGYLDKLTGATEELRRIVGKPAEITCRWGELTDEKFEELCYDVLCESERYDPTTIKKMGKARSRDGGRDLEVMSRGRAGKPPIKWVVQCKLIRNNSSLTSTKMRVSDTLDQYGARGFCVMTSGIIDSTLYDKLEGISRNRGVEVDHWSRLELERFLARRPYIRDRYFPR